MNTNSKKIFAFSCIALFVFMFAVTFVSAQESPSNFLTDFWDDWVQGGQEGLSPGLAKVLVFLLIGLIVYSVSGGIPFLSSAGNWVKGLFSGIVAFLSTAYLTPDQVFGFMAGYDALGFTLGIGVPFIILAVFTFRLASSGTGVAVQIGNQFIAIGLWIAFTVFAFVRAWQDTSDSRAYSWIVAVVALLITLAMHSIMVYVMSLMRKETREEATKMVQDSVAWQKSQAGALEEMADK